MACGRKCASAIVGDGKPRVSGHIAYRAVLPIGEVEEEYRPNSVVLWAGPKTHLVHYPLRRGELFNLVAVFHSDRYEEGWNVFGDTEELDLRSRTRTRRSSSCSTRSTSGRCGCCATASRSRAGPSGRVTLVGDAAHPMLQYLAQGAGMAHEDAVVLAHQVAAAGDDYATAFRAYNEARYLRTARVQLYARLYGDFYHAEGVRAELRNELLKPMPGKKPAKAWRGCTTALRFDAAAAMAQCFVARVEESAHDRTTPTSPERAAFYAADRQGQPDAAVGGAGRLSSFGSRNRRAFRRCGNSAQ